MNDFFFSIHMEDYSHGRLQEKEKEIRLLMRGKMKTWKENEAIGCFVELKRIQIFICNSM